MLIATCLVSNLRYFGIVPRAPLQLHLAVAKFFQKGENTHTGPFSATPGAKAGLHFTAAFILVIFSKKLSQEQRQAQANILPISEFTGIATSN